MPGVALAERQLDQLERVVIRALGTRIEEARMLELPAPERGSPDGGRSPAEVMADLLRRSIGQTPAEGERSLVEMLVRELVPDEARILAAMADGTTFPVLHLEGVIANVSSVGRAAGVVLPERVPTYVSHLRNLDLVSFGPEDPSLREEYDILLTDSAVLKARSLAGRMRRVRIQRATLRVSDLGAAVWAECSHES
jgi:hypothetical protein